jgi:hypothetical protein
MGAGQVIVFRRIPAKHAVRMDAQARVRGTSARPAARRSCGSQSPRQRGRRGPSGTTPPPGKGTSRSAQSAGAARWCRQSARRAAERSGSSSCRPRCTRGGSHSNPRRACCRPLVARGQETPSSEEPSGTRGSRRAGSSRSSRPSARLAAARRRSGWGHRADQPSWRPTSQRFGRLQLITPSGRTAF